MFFKIDPDLAEDAKAISSVRPGEVYPVRGDLAHQKWLIAYVTDDASVYYYVYDRATKSGTLLFSNRPELENVPLVSLKPISYAARDGLTIYGYLTIPQGLQAPYPTVMLYS
jgi:dipeptidyl aminopeptidase/acylaminoacyl peptidase